MWYIYVISSSLSLSLSLPELSPNYAARTRRTHTMHLAGDDITAPRTSRYSRDIARGHRARALTVRLARAFERIERTITGIRVTATRTPRPGRTNANGSRVPRVPSSDPSSSHGHRRRRSCYSLLVRAWTRPIPHCVSSSSNTQRPSRYST